MITCPELLLDSYASASVEVLSSQGVKAAVIQVPLSGHGRSSQVHSNISADNTDTFNTGDGIVACDALRQFLLLLQPSRMNVMYAGKLPISHLSFHSSDL